MADNEFSKYFEEFNKSAFRLQTLSEYNVDEEKDEFSSFLSGEFKPSHEDSEWISLIKKNTLEGKKMTQVLLIHSPLTPYMRYGLEWWWEDQAKAGADIRWILPENIEKMKNDLKQDFWIFDDATVFLMNYDKNGRFLGAIIEKDQKKIKEYLDIKDRAMKNSVTLKEVFSLMRRGILK
jgi:hypothetical protein